MAVNRQIDVPTAEKMSEIFLEVIIALLMTRKQEDIDEEKGPPPAEAPLAVERDGLDLKSFRRLAADIKPDSVMVKAEKRNRKAATQKELADMVFGMKVVKHVKSNAIVLVKDGRTVGIGAVR